jgi:hypothetical protein
MEVRMPLTKKGHKIMAAMKEQYGDEEGERVFYASANAGKISGVHAAKDASTLVMMFDNDTEFLVDKGVVPSRDGYLKAHARVARVGVQKYKGYEVGLPDQESVTLYRPPEEVFARDSMRSHANKPVTLTHPQRMVDKTTWGRVAKGFSGNEVVRDGEFVRVPLMLTDAKAIDAYENGVRELSVGYTTDIDWTPGTTPKGERFDGVQREIRTNHHALVPVARGGADLNLDDAADAQYESQGASVEKCKSCGAVITGHPMTCPICGYDLKPVPHPGEDSTAADSGFAREEGIMPIIKMFDGMPISFADEVSAAAMEREFRKMQMQLADAGDFGGKKAPPFGKKKKDGTGKDDDSGDSNGSQDATGDSDADAIEARRRKVTAEDALKSAQGEIAVLRKQLADAGSLDARAEVLAEQRLQLLDAAKPFLPQGFKDAGKSLSEIRRAAVATQFNDAEIKDWEDSQFIGAFATMARIGQGQHKTGARTMADGMTNAMRTAGNFMPDNRGLLNDAEQEAEKAHGEYVKRLQDGYKNPTLVVRN